MVKDFLFGSEEPANSPQFTLNSIDWNKSLRLFVVVIAGAAATAAIDFIAKFVVDIDLGPYRQLIMPAITFALEAARRYVSTNLKA